MLLLAALVALCVRRLASLARRALRDPGAVPA
ncbi:MAG: hypothetical protein QOI41_469, partial [Myxococcales bacterium]|nr:hypothetical protein [Myxococcales bacterium]